MLERMRLCLEANRLGNYFQALREFGCDSLADLRLLTAPDFEELEIKPLHQRKLLMAAGVEVGGGAKKPVCVVWAAMSVDGFVAPKDGSIDWVLEATGGVELGATPFLAQCDGLIMGSRSFSSKLLVITPPGKRIVVLTGHPEKFHAPPALVHVRSSIGEALEVLQGEGCSRIAIIGATTVRSFVERKLIEEMTVVLVPRTLGPGSIPLFPAGCHFLMQDVRDTGIAGCIEIRYKISAPEY